MLRPAAWASARRVAVLVMLAILLAPSMLAVSAQAPPRSSAAAAAALTRAVPAADLPLIRDWLLGHDASSQLNGDPARLLDSLTQGTTLSPRTSALGWTAFFSAFGETPTADEQKQLTSFEIAHPHVAQQLRLLAAEVAEAQTLRTSAFARTTPEAWSELPGAVALLAADKGGRLSSQQLAALDSVDLPKLAQGADIIVHAAEGSADALRVAELQDEELSRSLPPGLLSGSTPDQPGALLTTLARARPVETNASFASALEALELAAGLPVDVRAASLLPPDLDPILANIVTAEARQLNAPSEDAARATLSTLGAGLSPLVRASVNLSLETAGQSRALGGGARPLVSLPSARDASRVIDLALQDEFGDVGTGNLTMTFTRGMETFALAMQRPLNASQESELASVETTLGPDLSAKIGSVLAAQAAFQRDLGPNSPAVLNAQRAWSQAGPLLASGTPLSVAEIHQLEGATRAIEQLRQLEGTDVAQIAASVLKFQTRSSTSAAPVLPTQRGNVIFDQEGVVIAGSSDATWSADAFPTAPTLFVVLGGNDTFLMPVAGVQGNSFSRTSVMIDISGDDRYEPASSFTLGAAQGAGDLPAFAMLLDVSGNDTYAPSASTTMGWGQDGYGLLVDLSGDDQYVARDDGLAGANTTLGTSSALGLLVDEQGNDHYSTSRGFATLDGATASSATSAVMVDVSGQDVYVKPCSHDNAVACFATPRTSDPIGAQGSVAFFDGGGANQYPRPTQDPADPAGRSSTVLFGGADIEEDGQRFVFAADATQMGDAANVAVGGARICNGNLCVGSPVDSPDLLDRNGDGIPDFVENTRGGSYRPTPDNVGTDADGDGWPDGVEWALGSDPYDASSYPAGIPAPPAPLPDPWGVAPLPGAGIERHDGFLVDLPPFLAIGLQGPTTYVHSYLLALDLGTSTDNGDIYLNATGANGFSLNLGGSSRYQPTSHDTGLAAVYPARGVSYTSNGVVLGASDNAWSVGGTQNHLLTLDPSDRVLIASAGVAALVGLGGNDSYVTDQPGLASVTQSHGLAVLLNAGDNNTFSAVEGRSLGYADAGGEAYVLALGGHNTFIAPSEAVVEASPAYPGGKSVFVSVQGNDVFDSSQGAPIAAKDRDSYQGQVIDATHYGLSSTLGAGEASAGPQALATFMDLNGTNTYFVLDQSTHAKIDISSEKRDHMRVSPVDDPSYGRVSIFLDANSGATVADPKSTGLLAVAAGTSAHASDDAVVDPTLESHYYLDLPRLGIVVGAPTGTASRPTVFPAGRDYALLIALGGTNVIRSRAGASSPRFPTSLAIALGGDDVYDFKGGSNLTDFAPFALTNASTALPNVTGVTSSEYSVRDAVYGGAQGAGVFGIGVLLDSSPATSFAQRTEASFCCNTSAVAIGASQGAGVVGVGVLILNASSVGDSSAEFRSNVTARTGGPTDEAGLVSIARNVAQGAGVEGIGILADLRPTTTGHYLLEVNATGGNQTDAASAGQGFGARGVGILVDDGGDDSFQAGGLAQGAADGDAVPRTEPLGIYGLLDSLSLRAVEGDLPVSSSAMGVLLLPGPGRNAIVSTNDSQAFARGSGVAFLYDAEGPDDITLTATPAFGQAAATGKGFALLFSDRGDDDYSATTNAQGFASDEATALLVDLSGADTYRAEQEAQAFVAPGSASTPVPFALLLDVSGDDSYHLAPGGAGQGSGSPESFAGSTAVVATGIGAALFLDAAGSDHYESSPPTHPTLTAPSSAPLQAPPRCGVPALMPSCSAPGNDVLWYTLPDAASMALYDVSGRGSSGIGFASIGIDTDTATEALDQVLALPAIACSIAPADVASSPVCAPIAVATLTVGQTMPLGWGAIQGNVTLFVNLSLTAAGQQQTLMPPGAPPSAWVDRVEIYLDGFLIGRLTTPSRVSPYPYTLAWSTNRTTGIDAVPTVPDGTHELEAWIFPRAAVDTSGAHAAIDPQPIRVKLSLVVDNPPLPRAPDMASVPFAGRAVSTINGSIDLPLYVDRDAGGTCGANCLESVKHLPPGESIWEQRPPVPDPEFVADATDDGCSACAPSDPHAMLAGGKAYVWWEMPASTPSPIVGFHVAKTAALVATTMASPAGVTYAAAKTTFASPTATLTSDVDDSATTTEVAVSSTDGFPTQGTLLVGGEKMTYTSSTATSFTVTRATNGTTIATHATGASVKLYEISSAAFLAGPSAATFSSPSPTCIPNAIPPQVPASQPTVLPCPPRTKTNSPVLFVESTSGFPDGGVIQIGEERFSYTGLTRFSFTGVQRAVAGSSASPHRVGDALMFVSLAPDAVSDTINVTSTDRFPSQGTVRIDAELFTYAAKTPTSFTGVLRTGAHASHEAGAAVALVSFTKNAELDTLPVQSTRGFPDQGILQIDNELFAYEERSATGFSGITRAFGGTASAEHLVGASVSVGARDLGFIDARAAFVEPTSQRRLFLLRDADPNVAIYKVTALRREATGYVGREAVIDLVRPASAIVGPALGLNATGGEGGVYLTWRPSDAAAGRFANYLVERCSFDPYAHASRCHADPREWAVAGVATEPTFVDDVANITKDTPYLYRIEPFDRVSAVPDTYEYPIPQDDAVTNTTAMAAPGENVTLTLARMDIDERYQRYTAMPEAGGQTDLLHVETSGIPDGHYDLTTRQTDARGRSSTFTVPLVLDGTPPATTVFLPPYIGGPSAHGGGIDVPFAADDGDGAGVAATHVFAQLDGGAWEPLLANPATGIAFFPKVNDGSTLSVIAFSQDAVGNLEGASYPSVWEPSVDDAFNALLSQGAISRSVIDITPPFSQHQDRDVYVQQGAPVSFSLPVIEAGSGIESVRLLAGSDSRPMSSGDGHTWSATWNTSVPGRYQIFAAAVDNAGNVGTTELGTVTVDGIPPAVEDVSVDYGGGRHAGRAGDVVTARIHVDDDTTPLGKLRVVLDTSSVSTRPIVNLTYDLDARVYAGTFALDRLRNDTVRLTVTDLAGNAASWPVRLDVNGTVPALSNITVVPTADSIVVNWTSDVNTQGRALYGTTPALGSVTALDAPSRTHTAVLTGLAPDTDYYVKVDSVTPNGVEATSDLRLVHTGQGLALKILSERDFPLSRGASLITVEARDHHGTLVDGALVRVSLISPRGATQVITTGRTHEGEVTIPLTFASYQDGNYTLLLDASEGSISGNLSRSDLVIDRTAPTIDLVLPGSIEPGQLLQANVSERGSGLDVGDVSWTFGLRGGESVRCPVTLVGDGLTCKVPDLQRAGPVAVHITAPDVAGNVGLLDQGTSFSSGELSIENVHVATKDGFPHLRRSAGAVLSFDVDGALPSRVIVDLSSVGGYQAVLASPLVGTHYEVEFQPGPSVPDGVHTLTIDAWSAQGRERSTTVAATVDGTPPTGHPAIESGAIYPTSAVLTLVSDEPVSVQLAIDSPQAIARVASAASLSHEIRVDGLRPSSDTTAQARLTDLAGNVAIVPLHLITSADTLPPGGVTALVAEDDGDGHIRLHWDAATDDSGVDGYRVERHVGNATTTLPLAPGTSATDIVPTNVVVTYDVRALDLGGNMGPSRLVSITSVPVPHVFDGLVEPASGGPGTYTYRVRVVDASVAAAPRVVVIVDGVEHAMTTTAVDCVNGCPFQATVALGPTLLGAPHAFSFRVESPQSTVIYPSSDELPGPLVIAGAPPPSGSGIHGLSQVPALTLAAILVCVFVATILIWRRRR